MAVLKTWNATALTGGAVRALDAIPIASLTDLDRAFVVASDTIYYYEFDSAATDTEASPSFIRPDDYATAGVWKLARWYTQEDAYESNLFINSNFIVNQEAYVSGVITTGSYGHDMMKSISSANYTFASSALTMVSGTLGQRNDDLISVDGESVTISVQSGSLTIGATAGAAATVVTSGSPYSWTLDMSGSAFITITAATAAYGIKIESGSTATNYVVPEPRAEENRCYWKYQKIVTEAILGYGFSAGTTGGNYVIVPVSPIDGDGLSGSFSGTHSVYDRTGSQITISSLDSAVVYGPSAVMLTVIASSAPAVGPIIINAGVVSLDYMELDNRY